MSCNNCNPLLCAASLVCAPTFTPPPPKEATMTASSTPTPTEEAAYDIARSWAAYNAAAHPDSPEKFGEEAARAAQAFLKQIKKVDES